MELALATRSGVANQMLEFFPSLSEILFSALWNYFLDGLPEPGGKSKIFYNVFVKYVR